MCITNEGPSPNKPTLQLQWLPCCPDSTAQTSPVRPGCAESSYPDSRPLSCPAARLQIQFHETMRQIRGIYSSKYSYSFPSPIEDPNSMPLSSSGHLIISSFMFKKKKWGKHDQNIRLLKNIYMYIRLLKLCTWVQKEKIQRPVLYSQNGKLRTFISYFRKHWNKGSLKITYGACLNVLYAVNT